MISYAIEILEGGVETTASATLWLLGLYALSKNSKVQEELYREISSVVKDSVTISADMLTNLPYLKACVKEQMRLVPTFHALESYFANKDRIRRPPCTCWDIRSR